MELLITGIICYIAGGLSMLIILSVLDDDMDEE